MYLKITHSVKKWIAPSEKQVWQLEVFLKELKKNFHTVFSKGLGKCTMAKAVFQLKENVVPVFKPKCSVSFAVVEPINKELDRL